MPILVNLDHINFINAFNIDLILYILDNPIN